MELVTTFEAVKFRKLYIGSWSLCPTSFTQTFRLIACLPAFNECVFLNKEQNKKNHSFDKRESSRQGIKSNVIVFICELSDRRKYKHTRERIVNNKSIMPVVETLIIIAP